MDAALAAQKINGVSFMPGWTFEAETDPYSFGIDTAVRMRALIDTVNSDRDQCLKGYPEEITIAPETAFDAEDVTTEYELYAVVLRWAQEIFMHEAREFLRVGPDRDAPFHPHKDTGNARWLEVTGR